LAKDVVEMGGGEHAHKIHIPDWREYKVDGIKDLEWTRKALAEKGLKDPWLRNEVWRYQNWPGFGRSALINFGRGFKWAFAAMVVTVAIDQAFGISKSKHQQHHGDGGHGDAGHH
jgi:NADH dehydrogenase (ubiquinone) 1 beta subcomplex subunit 3